MKYNKVYIAGAGGMLGSYVYNKYKQAACEILATDIDVNEEWLQYGDIRDYTIISKQIKDFNPDIILNLAALTDLEECEVNYNNCFATNTMGAIFLMELSKELNIPYVFISTAGVFGGEQDVFVDYDIPNPLSIYAKSKVYAENSILEYDKAWIFRAGWMMGGGIKKDKKFVAKIFKQIENGITELNVVDDKLGTPTYTGDFANSIYRHTTEDLDYGIYNMVSKGDASRYDVAVKMIELLKLDINVNKVNSLFFKHEYFAPRPFSEKLINFKLNVMKKNYMNKWQDSLIQYLKEFYEK
jgi:dTDP-4-dehydrorhamnose reductase